MNDQHSSVVYSNSVLLRCPFASWTHSFVPFWRAAQTASYQSFSHVQSFFETTWVSDGRIVKGGDVHSVRSLEKVSPMVQLEFW